jgi:threonine dehydrogenase-like Zn-dependent dehydrogenase
MRGAVFLGDRQVELREFDDPEPGPGEVLIRVRASGMCGSDLHFYRERPGTDNTDGAHVAGHEPAGEVIAVGIGVDPAVAAIGDRVMIHHYLGCGVCDQCRSGWPQMCRVSMRVFGTHVHGGHAALMTAPASIVVRLPDTLSFEAGAAISCGTGTAWGGLQRLGDIGGAWVVIFGQGPVGVSGTMLATARGARVIAVDMVPARLAQARAAGAEHVLNPATDGVPAAIREICGDAGVPFILETSGSTAAISQALAVLGPWGRIALVGLGGEVRFPVLGMHRLQVSILPSISMSIMGQRQCAEFIGAKDLDISSIFTHRWSLEQVEDAYSWFDEQSAGKGVIVFPGGPAK